MKRTYKVHPCADCGADCAHNARRCQPCAGRHRYVDAGLAQAMANGRKRSPAWAAAVAARRKPYIVSHGYAYVYMPDHPAATKNGRVRRSVLVAEATLGRHLRPNEIVHHRHTGNTLHDVPENLEPMTRGEHRRLHGSGWSRRLTPPQVSAIRTQHAAGVTMTALGQQYGISRPAVSALLQGKTYQDVP